MAFTVTDATRLGARSATRPARDRKPPDPRQDLPATCSTAEFTIPGDPVPWARAGKNGKRHFTKEAQATHMADVRIAWCAAGRPWLGLAPISLQLRFYRERPPSHYGTGRNAGRVRASAPAWPTGTPDTSNLVKLVEDALNQQLYWDDGQVVHIDAHLEWADDPRDARTELRASIVTST